MMTSHYDPVLVIASVLVAMFASYTAIDLSSSVAHAKGWARAVWLAAGATAMGFGIWSMHFVGMLSFTMPGVAMGYDIPLMGLSVLIAIAASALALYVVSFHHITHQTMVLAGLTMGLAIAGMHYTGMASMRMPAKIIWNYWLVALSYVIAAIASLMALRISFQLRDELAKPARRRVQIGGGVVVMGLAISGMHYVGMAAATFVHADKTVSSNARILATSNLTVAVISTTALILGMALSGSLMQRALARKTAIADALREERTLRERFVSILTHDLRNPLTAARLNAVMLDNRNKNLEINDRKFLRQIIDNVDRAEGMIHNLLDVQRISANQPLPLQPENIDLVTLTDETIQGLRVVYGDRFVLKNPSSLSGCWDAGYLRRLIENLCSNAIKYGDPKEPVTVTLADLGSDIELCIHNKGDPLLLEDQKNLFRLFHRAPSAQKSDRVGWGIGLTLVKGVVESHGGTIGLKSVKEEGTTFIVRLPKTCHTGNLMYAG